MAEKKWSCMIQGKVLGPMSRDDVVRMIAKGMLRETDYVRDSDTANWEQLVYARRRLNLELYRDEPKDKEGDEYAPADRDEDATIDIDPAAMVKGLLRRRAVWGVAAAVVVLIVGYAVLSGDAGERLPLTVTDPERSFEVFGERFVEALREVSRRQDARDTELGNPVENVWDETFITQVEPTNDHQTPYRASLAIGRRVNVDSDTLVARYDGIMTFGFELLNRRWVIRTARYDAERSTATTVEGLSLPKRSQTEELSDRRIIMAYNSVDQETLSVN